VELLGNSWRTSPLRSSGNSHIDNDTNTHLSSNNSQNTTQITSNPVNSYQGLFNSTGNLFSSSQTQLLLNAMLLGSQYFNVSNNTNGNANTSMNASGESSTISRQPDSVAHHAVGVIGEQTQKSAGPGSTNISDEGEYVGIPSTTAVLSSTVVSRQNATDQQPRPQLHPARHEFNTQQEEEEEEEEGAEQGRGSGPARKKIKVDMLTFFQEVKAGKHHPHTVQFITPQHPLVTAAVADHCRLHHQHINNPVHPTDNATKDHSQQQSGVTCGECGKWTESCEQCQQHDQHRRGALQVFRFTMSGIDQYRPLLQKLCRDNYKQLRQMGIAPFGHISSNQKFPYSKRLFCFPTSSSSSTALSWIVDSSDSIDNESNVLATNKSVHHKSSRTHSAQLPASSSTVPPPTTAHPQPRNVHHQPQQIHHGSRSAVEIVKEFIGCCSAADLQLFTQCMHNYFASKTNSNTSDSIEQSYQRHEAQPFVFLLMYQLLQQQAKS
jgi:hypothetical protein